MASWEYKIAYVDFRGRISSEGVEFAALRDPKDLALGEDDFGPAGLVGPDSVAGEERHVADSFI